MIIAVIPWALLVIAIICDEAMREIRRAKETKRIHYEVVGQFECLYSDDPCLTNDPVFGIECDNCVQFRKKEPSK